MTEINQSTGRGANRVRIDTDEAKRRREEIRKQELEKYQVVIPEPKGSGRLYDQVQELAGIMLQLYQETQNLISASGKLIEDIAAMVENADKVRRSGRSDLTT